LWDSAQDNELYTFVGDFELPPKFDDLVEAVAELRRKGKIIEYTTIPDYLDRFGTKGEEFYTPCSWTETVENPSFVRWTADPQDIIVHKATAQAMDTVRAAEKLAAIAEAATGSKPNPAWNDVTQDGNPLKRDILTWSIECPDDFPDIESNYLAAGKEPTALDKAWHLLLWGVNSDARGWYPMFEKRRERVISLENAVYLSQKVAINSLAALTSNGDGSQESPSLVVFNPVQKRRAVIRLEGPVPYRAAGAAAGKCESVWTGNGYVSEIELELPEYGIKSVPIEIVDSSTVKAAAWKPGNRISTGPLSLEALDARVRLSTGAREWTMGLREIGRFGIREVHRGTVVHRSPYEVGPTMVYTRDGLYPELSIEKQLDWCIYYTANYRLEPDRVICKLKLEFTKPVLIGGSTHSGNTWIWFPHGLTYQIKGRPGDIWYDVPFGSIKHINQSRSHITALRYTLLQEPEGGISVIPRSGNQLFEVDGENGIIGVGLGASTLGTPAEPATQTLIPEEWVVLQDNRWEEEPFYGTYEHEFVIYPFDGTWQAADIPGRAEEALAPVFYSVMGSTQEETRSFIECSEPGVNITSLRLVDNRPTIRLVEELGLERRCTITFLGERKEIELKPYQIATIKF
ncbi:MAG: hypothetical protein GX855_06620, partial [Firmicutes bacterium]|nr:hypothetical protein [Bacillota bacterium]